jgi:hypothetical protein
MRDMAGLRDRIFGEAKDVDLNNLAAPIWAHITLCLGPRNEFGSENTIESVDESEPHVQDAVASEVIVLAVGVGCRRATKAGGAHGSQYQDISQHIGLLFVSSLDTRVALSFAFVSKLVWLRVQLL